MSLFNLPVVHKRKPVSVHPWARTIKDEYSHKIKRAHNSINNIQIHPRPYTKEKIPNPARTTFMVIGNRLTKDFIYCVNLVKGLHKYKWKCYHKPIIRGVTTMEWPHTILDIQIEYGQEAYCLESQVVVIMNGKILGGKLELKQLVEKEYIYYLALNYHKESINNFATFISGSGRPCAYLHISIDDEPIGTLIFMLYSDIVPYTCENFLRLCKTKMGGYSGTPVHRIVKDGWIQCGGYGLKNTPLECENFIISHDRRGVLGMANDGRYLDCSTQFYVLLQPNEWLKFQYVAFGQLIEGEETLRKIEAVTTFYESPTANIIINKTGVLNLDCRDIAINKTTIAYLEKHTEDLISLEELLYQILIENVFLEIEYRMLQLMEPPEEEGEDLTKEEKEKRELLAAKRAKRQKEEIMIEIRKSRAGSQDGRSHDSIATHATRMRYVNADFGEESYEIEAYSYSQVTVRSLPPKRTKPYYLEFTDIPYPGEVDSNYDLKRFLVGDYCLESDLNVDQPKKLRADLKQLRDSKMQSIAKLITSYAKKARAKDSDSSSSTSWSSVDLESDEEKEIEEYLKENGEKVSFAGKKVNKIARTHVTYKKNPLDNVGPRDCFTEEDIRRMRLAGHELEEREKKKISISVQPWTTHKEIKRRQTGFVRYVPELDEEDEDEEEDKKYKSQTETIKRTTANIQASSGEDTQKASVKKKRAGFATASDVLVKIRSLERHLEGDDEDEGKDELKPKVRIVHSFPTEKKVPKTEQQFGDDKRQTRPSVLARLYSDVGLDSEEAVPTLKDYKPSKIGMRKDEVATLGDLESRQDHLLRRAENVFLRSFTAADDDSEKELFVRKPKRTSPDKHSELIEEKKEYRAINAPFEKRQRPWLTVSQYQIKNAQKPNTNNKGGKSKEN